MRKTPLIVLLLAFALLLAACASTEDETTTTTAAAAEETTTTAAAEETTTTAAAEETTTTTEADAMADWPEEVIYGFIPSERQEKLADTVQPYMDYLTETIGCPTFTGVVTADYNGLVVAMGAGNADLGAFGPFGYVQAKELYSTIEVLIQSIRFGSDLYHGQWFTNDPSICADDPVPGTALINQGGEWQSLGLNVLVVGCVPILVTQALLRLAQRRLPHNFFVYVYINGFLAAGLSTLAVSLLGALLMLMVDGGSSEWLSYQYYPYFPLIFFSEAFVNGMIMTALVALRPGWVSSFDDNLYINNK